MPPPCPPAGGAAVTYSVVSLFSGAMGLDVGLEQTGRFVTRAASELVPSFCKTILRNRDAGLLRDPGMAVYEGDIRGLDCAAVLDDVGLAAGELDLLVGGPPCQAFSTSGKRRTMSDPRGTLLWEMLRFVEEMQPRFFLIENVRGLMSAALQHRPIADRPENGGPPLEECEEPGSVVSQFMADLDGKYRLDIFEVNAVNYGAPQLRERVLFIGNRLNRLVELPDPTHGLATRDAGTNEPTLFGPDDGPAPLKPFRTLGEALEGLHDPDPVCHDFSARKKHYLSMVPPGSNWRSLPPEIAQESMGKAYFAKGGRSGWWRRLSMDLPSPTVVAIPSHASTSLCHPTETRALTLRECARIQEFPDEWQFEGTPHEQFTQVGNAVPVRLGRVAGDAIAAELNNCNSGEPAQQGAVPAIRHIYLQSHVRTRQWYKNGQTVVRTEGDTSSNYGPPRTIRREHTIRQESD